MIARAGSNDSSARPASPAGSLGVPVGTPGFAGASARTAHAPSAEVGAGGDAARAAAIAREPLAGDALGSDVGGDLVAGGALLETGLAQRNALPAGASMEPDVAPFVPGPGSPTDGTRVEAIDAARGSAAARSAAAAADVDDGLTADGPGGPGVPQGDVEAGGNISDSVDEAAGMDGSNAPNEAPPADAGAQGGQS